MDILLRKGRAAELGAGLGLVTPKSCFILREVIERRVLEVADGDFERRSDTVTSANRRAPELLVALVLVFALAPELALGVEVGW